MAIAYKLLRKKGDKLFPLYVLSNEEVPVGVWLDAKEGEKLQNGKVKSKLGPLQFRPGWHLSDIPLAVHIGIRVFTFAPHLIVVHVFDNPILLDADMDS